MLSVALSRPEKRNGVGFYGGRIALMRCTKDIVAKRNSKFHQRGEIYKQYTTLNNNMFRKQLTRTILPNIKSDISLLDKSERFVKTLKEKSQAYNLPSGCK